jgi:hypothetical protein
VNTCKSFFGEHVGKWGHYKNILGVLIIKYILRERKIE